MPRPWFQFRLKSLLFAVLVTVLLVWANFRPREVTPWHFGWRSTQERDLEKGWPIPWYCQRVKLRKGDPTESGQILVFDLGVCFLCGIAALVVAEMMLRAWRFGQPSDDENQSGQPPGLAARGEGGPSRNQDDQTSAQ